MDFTQLTKIPNVYKQLECLLINVNILGTTIKGYVNELHYINQIYYTHRFGSYDERKQLASLLSPPLPPSKPRSNSTWSESSGTTDDQSESINYLQDQIDSLTFTHEIEVAELKEINNKQYHSNIIEQQHLVDEVLDLTDKVEQMEPDYKRYQYIKNFESIYNKLLILYEQDNAIDLSNALYADPNKATDLLGDDPVQEYHAMRKTRNLIAHCLI